MRCGWLCGRGTVMTELAACARRGRRRPVGAHAGAVGAARRLRCVPGPEARSFARHNQSSGLVVSGLSARPGVASHNSLRSLRSLRSNRCDELVYEARHARRPRACAPRRPRNRPHRAPPAAQPPVLALGPDSGGVREGGCGQTVARLWGAEERKAHGRARSALRQLTRRICSSAANAVRVVSYATGHVPEHRARTQTVLRTVCAWRGTGPLARARKAVGAQRRPLQRSAAACPHPPSPPRGRNA